MSSRPYQLWTVEDACALRACDGARRQRQHDALGRRLDAPIAGLLRGAARVLGDRVWTPGLDSLAARMGRHQSIAFAGHELGAGEVLVSAYVKAGTNWVMHICHQLAQLGEAEFDHIQDVISWPDAAEPRYWRDLRAPGPESPTGYRVIKSHLPRRSIQMGSGAKAIAVTRDPLDCAASGYAYFSRLFLGPLTPPPDVWLDHFGSDRAVFGPWYDFTGSWWDARHEPGVLFLRYEELRARPTAGIAAIGRFLGIDLNPELLDRVEERTSFAAMKRIDHKFYPVRQTIWSRSEGRMMRSGKVGDGRALFSQDAITRFRQRMAEGLAVRQSDFPHYDFCSLQMEHAS